MIMKRYEVWVYGQDVKNIPNVGGWQMFVATFNKTEALEYVKKYEQEFGLDNVDLK